MFRYSKIFVWFFIVVLSLSLGFSPAFAGLLEEKESELKSIDQAIEKQEKILAEKRKQSVSLKNQVDILNGEISKTQLLLDRTHLSLENIQDELATLSRKLVDTEVSMTEKKLLLGSVIRFAYERARFGVFEILVTSKNLSDLLNRWEYVSAIERKMGEILGSLRDLKGELAEQKSYLEEKNNELIKLQEGLVVQQNSLDIQKQAKESLLAQTQESEAKYQELLEQARKQQEALRAEIQRLAAAQGKKYFGPQTLSWPLSSRIITAYFHDKDYFRRFHMVHQAIDIATPFRTPIRAPADGKVVKVHFSAGSSRYAYMMVAHDNGLVTVYGHISQPLVSVGARVIKGQSVALSGGVPGTVGAGWLTTGAHLHFEVWKDGQAVNPLNYLS